MLWQTVNTLENINAISKLLLLLSASLGIFESVVEGAPEGEPWDTLIRAIKSFRSRKEAEELIVGYKITTDLVKQQSQDGDIRTTLGDMVNQLRLEEYGIHMRSRYSLIQK